ncbi:MAG: FAD-binding oxidoreductase [Gammaproteobacteria bacterium]|nr:FAD-binding oxidoreductase [Gammaproteobacteria bacterium]MYF27933.1 FAD-binding oxidoreductase [Gammaproteobacteria bacterium]MYK48485.1 FAD-binding oxidoreductase [Gammaproteobacteria bacterium]
MMAADASESFVAADHNRRARAFADALARACKRDGTERTLDKPLSNLFRDRTVKQQGLPAGELVHVLEVDARAGWVDVEGMIPYDALVDATLPHGVMPRVVPQLKSITVGGAVAGIGIEATSFRHGLVHETVLEMDVALADGRIVTAAPDNEHADLFAGMPNSYGTLGYATRLRVQTMPVKDYVEVRHRRFTDRHEFFAALDGACEDADVDFLDGVAFAADDLVLTTGRFADTTARTSDYTFEDIYYQSLRARESDCLAVRDYIWRWDTDWFWCSKNLGAQHPLVRRLLGRERLGSRFYQRVMRWNSRWRLLETAERLGGYRRESVIQDVDLPLGTAPDFLDLFMREIGILPVWICPVRNRSDISSPLFPAPADRYVNFGFWDTLRFRIGYPEGHFNRIVEQAVTDLGGIKSLYSSSFYEEAEFHRLYGGDAYGTLKRRYDPEGALGELYAKCVRGR